MDILVMVGHGICLLISCGPEVRQGFVRQGTNLNSIAEEVCLVHNEVQDDRTITAIDRRHCVAIFASSA